jgi:hypothetical protein
MYDEEYASNENAVGTMKRGLGDAHQESRPNLLNSLGNQERLISLIEKQFSELYVRLGPVLQPVSAEDAVERATSPTSERVMDVVDSHNGRLDALHQALRTVTRNLDV